MDITLMVPTMNRSDFIIRLLNYYYDHDFTGCILIGDSSGPEHVEKTRTEIDRLKDRLNVRYIECPGLNTNDTFEKLVAMVETSYIAYLGDDDLLVPSGLELCIKFLEDHPDYSAANGEARAFKLPQSGAYGQMNIMGVYPQPSIEDNTAAKRLLKHLEHYSVSIFSVHRTETWRIMWKDLNSVMDRSFGGEIIPCCLSVVLGKIKHLDCLYLLRQSHDQIYHLPGFARWVTSPDFYPSYKVFENSLAEQLVRVDGITPQEAEQVVKEAFSSYLFPIRLPRLVAYYRKLKKKYENYSENDTSWGFLYFKTLRRLKEPYKYLNEKMIRAMARMRSAWVVLWDKLSHRRQGLKGVSMTTKAKPKDIERIEK